MTTHVMIVDDSLTVRMDLTERFEAAGYAVVPCRSIADARAAVEAHRIAVAILDVHLPDGSGLDFLRELRATPGGATMAVLMLSTEAEVGDRVHGLERGADAFIGKPYDAQQVLARTHELLGDAGGTDDDPTTVLLIDDSATYRSEMRDALDQAGYVVFVAETGEDGLIVAARQRPDAILVDGILPGIDGAAVIRRIRLDAALRHTPCVLLTASDERDAELRALDSGADGFVRKHEEMDVILARVGAVLRRASAAPTEETQSVLGPKIVLAVDDSDTYLHELSETLREDGYEVVLARSGEEALEVLAVRAVDCILLDLLMPGLSGQETCRQIKAAPIVRDVPLIMLTALEDRSAMIDGLSAGADDYIAKSGEFDVLKARVRAQIRRRQFEDENRRIRGELLEKRVEAAEARAARELAETRAELVADLERKNKELEAFSYSVSHDLRAPLRGIDGFCQALLDDYGDVLDTKGQDYLRRTRAAAQRMGELIDDLLDLSRVGRAEILRTRVHVSEIARSVIAELRRREPDRDVDVHIADDLYAEADARLLRVLLENLLGNAWKFTARTPDALIGLDVEYRGSEPSFVVRDNGAGFNMSYVDKLFRPFQRLHRDADFPGTGIGLATVHRIVDRHGGHVEAHSIVGQGATFSFSLPNPRGRP